MAARSTASIKGGGHHEVVEDRTGLGSGAVDLDGGRDWANPDAATGGPDRRDGRRGDAGCVRSVRLQCSLPRRGRRAKRRHHRLPDAGSSLGDDGAGPAGHGGTEQGRRSGCTAAPSSSSSSATAAPGGLFASSVADTAAIPAAGYGALSRRRNQRGRRDRREPGFDAGHRRRYGQLFQRPAVPERRLGAAEGRGQGRGADQLL